MKFPAYIVCLSAVLAGSAFAQAPAAPVVPAATVNAVCKDGTPFSGETLKGACRGHGGVNKKATNAASAAPAATSNAAPVTPAPATAAAVTSAPATAAPKSPAAPMAQAPGGGADKVWANTSTKVYHCEGDKYYGKTKVGEYMTEADAKAKGMHGTHGKTCAK